MTHVYIVASELEAARASYCLSEQRRTVTRHTDPDGRVLVVVEGSVLPDALADALRTAAPSTRLAHVASSDHADRPVVVDASSSAPA